MSFVFHIPNTDGLKPGTTVPIVQWDHDMAYFVPMGQGTISEDGSVLVTNQGSGITKAGWGGGVNPITPNDANDGCEVTIFANNEEDELWEVNKNDGTEVHFTAGFKGSGCGQREMKWFINDTPFAFYEESAPTHLFNNKESSLTVITVQLEAICSSCDIFYVDDEIEIKLFLPKFEMEKDEKHKNGWFELIPQNGGQYYAERTNLEINVKYPDGHPDEGDIVENYSQEVTLKEYFIDEIISPIYHYNGQNGATQIPKQDIEFDKGIAKFHIDSVSRSFGFTNEWPLLAVIKIQQSKPREQNEDDLESLDIEQWIAESSVEVSPGVTNSPSMPDWIEKSVWKIVTDNKAAGGNIGMSFSYVSKVIPLLGGLFNECGQVGSGSSDTIQISMTCNHPIEYRTNQDSALSIVVFHEARHSWQFNIINTSIDADNDNIPLSVPPNSIVGVPFEDGHDKTRGDKTNDSIFPRELNCVNPDELPPPATCENPYFHDISPYTTPISFAGFLAERDASRFSCAFAQNPRECSNE